MGRRCERPDGGAGSTCAHRTAPPRESLWMIIPETGRAGSAPGFAGGVLHARHTAALAITRGCTDGRMRGARHQVLVDGVTLRAEAPNILLDFYEARLKFV
eukprot:5590838-Prymnesium_polylepis.1